MDKFGYSLYYDVTDFEKRNKNRGVALINLIEDHMNDEGSVSSAGKGKAEEYLLSVPRNERALVYMCAKNEALSRGYKFD